MKCERARELFSDYHEGSMDYALTETIRSHMDKCASCKHEFARMESIWALLNAMPEVDPPADFRQNVLFQLAQLQNESIRARRSLFGQGLGGLLEQLRAPRGIATACAGVALAAILLLAPVSPDRYTAGIFKPDVASINLPGDRDSLDKSAKSSIYDMAAVDKEKWISRKLVRNAVWATISSKSNGSDAMLYSIDIARNPNALVNSEAVKSARVHVYLVPAGQYNTDVVRNSQPDWRGLITETSSMLVPVVVDPGEGTLDLLVVWKSRDHEYAQFIFLPPKTSAQDSVSGQSQPAGGYEDLYSGLQSAARDFGVPVIANANLHVNVSSTGLGARTLERELKNMLRPAGIDWLCADGAVYVDKEYTDSTN